MKADNWLMELYYCLEEHFGKQNWWPAESSFEVILGAILTQNVNWNNVEKAIQNLRELSIITPQNIIDIDENKLEDLIEPTGFYKQKSKRLKRISRAIQKRGSLENFLNRNDLRNQLLSIKGIGPETADSISLYAAENLDFVVDSYTKRILRRTKNIEGNYHEIQSYIVKRLPKCVELYQEYHALLVELGKNYCQTKPNCEECPVKHMCSNFI